MSSHILSEVSQVADDIGIISGGVLGYQGELPQEEKLESLFMEIAVQAEGSGRDVELFSCRTAEVPAYFCREGISCSAACRTAAWKYHCHWLM